MFEQMEHQLVAFRWRACVFSYAGGDESFLAILADFAFMLVENIAKLVKLSWRERSYSGTENRFTAYDHHSWTDRNQMPFIESSPPHDRFIGRRIGTARSLAEGPIIIGAQLRHRKGT